VLSAAFGVMVSGLALVLSWRFLLESSMALLPSAALVAW